MDIIIGVNIDDSEEETIENEYFSIISQYKSDLKNPIGGVRNVIPTKCDYILY